VVRSGGRILVPTVLRSKPVDGPSSSGKATPSIGSFTSLSGWRLYCFLHGMKRGGDWLALPDLPRLSEIVDDLSRQSRESYGSDFAAYRVYDAPGLLEWLAP